MADAAPPPPIVRTAPVVYGRVAVEVGAGTARIETQVDGRIVSVLRLPGGPRRVSLRVPAGIHALRVRAVGRGGARWSATVRLRALPPSARHPGRVPGFVDRRLQGDVDAIVGRSPAVVGVYVQHLITGCGAASNADAQFPAASTLKAAILISAVQHGMARSLARTLDRMVIDSDDKAANAVLAALGGGSGEAGAARVTATLGALGLSRSLVRRPYIIDDDKRLDARPAGRVPLPRRADRQPELRTNFVTTPFELARLMVNVHRGALGRGGVARLGIGVRAARAELLARLLQVRDSTKLVAGLPRGTVVAHKTGYTKQVKHDAGIVYLARGPVVISVMTWSPSGVSDAAGDALIAEVARASVGRLAAGGSCRGLPLT